MKREIGTVPYLYPIPIVLVASKTNGKCSFATVGDVAVMGLNPPLMAVSLHKNHLTTEGITQTGMFSINMPTADMMPAVDYCGMYSGKQKSKSHLFETEDSPQGVPLIKQCPVSIVCRVIKHFNIEHRHIFIGRVQATFADDKYASGSEGETMAEMEKLNPLMYGLDNKYYSIGKQIGMGYSAGKSFVPPEE